MSAPATNAPPRLFLGNFDFEAALVAPSASTSREAERRNSELAFAWLAIARPGDVIVTHLVPAPDDLARLQSLGRGGVRFARPDERFDADLQVTPWGWDERVLRWAQQRGLTTPAPPLEAVLQANSRRFSFNLEHEFRCGLDRQAVCTSLDEIQRAVTPLNRWLIKANFGAAGRERLSGTGSITADATRWLQRRLARDGVVFVEPFVDAIEEAGIQWEIPPAPAAPMLIGVAPLQSDARGQYLGSLISDEPALMERWQPAIEICQQAAVRIQKLGYLGPLGIDAMHYRDGQGAVRVRALQDINARWTMGRLSLGWRDLVPSGTTGFFRCGDQMSGEPAETSIRISPYPGQGQTLSHMFSIECRQVWGEIPSQN